MIINRSRVRAAVPDRPVGYPFPARQRRLPNGLQQEEFEKMRDKTGLRVSKAPRA